MTRKSNDDIHNPVYAINCAAKYRKREGALSTWSREDRQQYGALVHAAILLAQARETMRACEPMRACPCASGTWINVDDGSISRAVAAQNNARLLAAPAAERAARTPLEWEQKYLAAMPEGFIPSWERNVTELEPIEEAA